MGALESVKKMRGLKSRTEKAPEDRALAQDANDEQEPAGESWWSQRGMLHPSKGKGGLKVRPSSACLGKRKKAKKKKNEKRKKEERCNR